MANSFPSSLFCLPKRKQRKGTKMLLFASLFWRNSDRFAIRRLNRFKNLPKSNLCALPNPDNLELARWPRMAVLSSMDASCFMVTGQQRVAKKSPRIVVRLAVLSLRLKTVLLILSPRPKNGERKPKAMSGDIVLKYSKKERHPNSSCSILILCR